jgi:hypothetical protein
MPPEAIDRAELLERIEGRLSELADDDRVSISPTRLPTLL